ncbi:MAG: metalloregulator ArsR/SmtB family transcription factor [Actinobacteria bacterium]|jgi:ArsR family transcriptional regulator|nr:metalloregulator ArsR/SmtB family transcription factor [Actinomycetota bacterium]MBU1866165.1 metalloregulator ArsR/SmtB family transcription factor [Actinomycetota bacterium]
MKISLQSTGALQASDRHAEAFKALAHLTRLQVFFLLAAAGRELAAGEIAAAANVPGPTLSRHLDILRRSGLVTSRREERYIYYTVAPEMASELVRLLVACC